MQLLSKRVFYNLFTFLFHKHILKSKLHFSFSCVLVFYRVLKRLCKVVKFIFALNQIFKNFQIFHIQIINVCAYPEYKVRECLSLCFKFIFCERRMANTEAESVDDMVEAKSREVVIGK